jgi:hypothetical protein
MVASPKGMSPPFKVVGTSFRRISAATAATASHRAPPSWRLPLRARAVADSAAAFPAGFGAIATPVLRALALVSGSVVRAIPLALHAAIAVDGRVLRRARNKLRGTRCGECQDARRYYTGEN